MTLQQRGPLSPHNFPGSLGRTMLIRTNLFDMTIKPNTIGLFEVYGTQSVNNGKWEPVDSKKLYSMFINSYAKELKGYEVVEGYPTENGLFVYTVPAYPKDEFPKKEFTPRPKSQPQQVQHRGNRGHPSTTFRVWAQIRKDHKYVGVNNWKTAENELKAFLKRAALQNIAQLFVKHGYQLLKKGIYTFERNRGAVRFPVQPLNDVMDVVSGFKVGFELNVPKPDESSRNMVSIDLTQNVMTRTNISLFKCYVDLCVYPEKPNLRPVDIKKGQMISKRGVAILNCALANFEVYIQGEKDQKGKFSYYKFVQILDQPATNVKDKSGKSIVQYYEQKLKIKLENPSLNAVELKRQKSVKHVPLELIMLSDRPQKICTAAMSMLPHLNEKACEMAAVVPVPRWKFIESIADKMSTELQDSSKKNLLKSVGININPAPIDVYGRVLDEPTDSAFISPFTLASPCKDPFEYVIVDFHRYRRGQEEDNMVENYVNGLMQRLKNNFGLNIVSNDENAVKYFKFDLKRLDIDLKKVVSWNSDVIKKNKNKLLYIIVVDKPDNKLHERIKFHFDDNTMVSQVITLPVLQKVKPTYRQDCEGEIREFSFNIALQINAKTDGKNFTPSDDREHLWKDEDHIMFIGIDTRLSSERGKIGLVGIMTSSDLQGIGYNSYVTTTDGLRKYCGDYSKIISKALDAYKDSNEKKVFPKKIVVFRAGMSEYDLVKSEGPLEKKHINSCIEEYMKDRGIEESSPKITYIGYHRSHGVRFYNPNELVSQIKLKNDTDPKGIKANVPVGTVIDREITSTNVFYFVSHETFMGTLKPAKYTIVEDGNSFKPDTLLATVYQLCRLNPQTKRSFRRPVPIGLAAKLLERCVLVRPKWMDSMKVNEEFKIKDDFVNRPFYI